MKAGFTFSKPERLCSKKAIGQLFESDEKWACFPFRLVIRLQDRSEFHEVNAAPIQILISASKRSFKHAVDRNRIKRQIREAYRLNKETLYVQINDRLSESPQKILHIGFIYTSKKMEDWSLMEKKMIQALTEIGNKLNTTKTTE